MFGRFGARPRSSSAIAQDTRPRVREASHAWARYMVLVPAAVFMFTDVEGSTRRWADHPGEMGSMLARHDAILRAAVEAAGGEVFKHTGDGVAAAFASATEAVRAAAAAQRELGAQDWGSVGSLRVRMAL